MQKDHERAWHDHHIEQRTFKSGDFLILYDSKFTKFLRKLQMDWQGPYIVKEITNGGAVHLVNLNGELFLGKVNGSQLKLYRGYPSPTQWLYECKKVLLLHEVARECGTINYTTRRIVWRSRWVARWIKGRHGGGLRWRSCTRMVGLT